MNKHLLLLFTMSLFIFMGCEKKEQVKEKEGLTVVTTFYPMYDFSQKIVGDSGEVTMLMGGDVEPHDYEPSAKDVAKIQEADIFVYSSADMETWVPTVLKSIDTSKTKVIEASKGIEMMEGEEHEEHDEEGEHEEEHHHEIDPHVWLDPVLAQTQVTNIFEGITEASSEHRDSYQKNYDSFISELKQLDEDYRSALLNAENKTFVTQHAAFGYLAQRYDLHQVAITGLNSEEEPSAKVLAELETFVRDNKIATIYVEKASSSKMADTIANATGISVSYLTTLESMPKKEMEKGEDYLSAMKNNLEALKETIK